MTLIKSQNIQYWLNKYIQDLINPDINFYLGLCYESIGQTASAVSFFLRSVEFGTDDNKKYESLLKMALCFERQGNRIFTIEGVLLRAISLCPRRPQAYFLLSRLYERNKKWQECYTMSILGYKFADDIMETQSYVEYPGKFSLLFETAVSAWWIGLCDESIKLFKQLLLNHSIDELHRNAVINNLKNLDTSSINLIDIVLQGQYNDYVSEIANHYLQLSFVNNIIISCWEEDIIPESLNHRIKYIKSKLPLSAGTGNRNLQIVSSLAGLKRVGTEFAIKMRNDQKFTLDSMIKMYEFYQLYKKRVIKFDTDETKPKNRICVSGNFTPFPFHPRDHVFWGNTEDLIDVFNIPLDTDIQDKISIKKHELDKYYHCYIRTESYIGSYYCSNFNKEIKKWLLNPENYLYDNAPYYNEAKALSEELTPKIFKSFPKKGIDLEWPKYGWNTYPYDTQKDQFGEYWHEDCL